MQALTLVQRLIAQKSAIIQAAWQPGLLTSYCTTSSTPHDGLSRWLKDHEAIRQLFARYRDAPSRDAQQAIVAQIIRANVQHVSAEDRTLYPAFGRVIPQEAGAEALQTHGQLVDVLGRYMFKWLDARRPANDVEWRLYDRTVRQAMSLLDEHFKDEEEVAAPYLRSHLSGEELEQLGKAYEAARDNAPTHPHPLSPVSPLASKVAHPVAGAMDRMTDRVKEALGSAAPGR